MESNKTEKLEAEIAGLLDLLNIKEQELSAIQAKKNQEPPSETLLKEDVERFSRQIILPGIGNVGQLALKASRILIVGVGGLGCPAAQYLTGAGVGHIGLVDYDVVERSNLHRQLLHREGSIGLPKVSSASRELKKLNSNLKIYEYHVQLDSSNALDIVSRFEVVVDATDNVATRYLLNDACVLSGRPLVSGSALRLEGQLTVYNHKNGPCYRCLFPKPPPPETVTNCGDGGVLGAVPGVIGILEALEAVKIVLGWSGILSGQLLLFNADVCTFRNVRLRTKNVNCDVCGERPVLTQLIDYEQFCGSKATDKDSTMSLLSREDRVNAETLRNSLKNKEQGLLIDVRNPEEFSMCALPHSVNIPLKNIDDPSSINKLTEMLQCGTGQYKMQVFVVCRRGNDSQKAVLKLKESLKDYDVAVRDLEGGLHAWAKIVDTNFPVY